MADKDLADMLAGTLRALEFTVYNERADGWVCPGCTFTASEGHGKGCKVATALAAYDQARNG